jgi:hypothetical protein
LNITQIVVTCILQSDMGGCPIKSILTIDKNLLSACLNLRTNCFIDRG